MTPELGIQLVLMIAVSFVIRQVVNLFELGVRMLEKAKDASAWVGDAVGNAMFGQSGVEYLSNGSSRSPGEKLTDNTVKIINPEDIARAIAEKENDEKIRKEHEAQLWGGTKLSDLEFKLEELLWEEQKLSSTMDKFGNLSGMDMLLGNLRDEIVNLFDLTEKARKEDAEFNKKNLRSKSKSQPVKIDKESIDLFNTSVFVFIVCSSLNYVAKVPAARSEARSSLIFALFALARA